MPWDLEIRRDRQNPVARMVAEGRRWGMYIDNVDAQEVGPSPWCQTAVGSVSPLMEEMDDLYESWGSIDSPRDRVDRCFDVTSLGVRCVGRAGVRRPPKEYAVSVLAQ